MYMALRLVSRTYKFFAMVIAVMGVLSFLYGLYAIVTTPDAPKIGGFTLPSTFMIIAALSLFLWLAACIIFAVFVYGAGQLIDLLVSIEKTLKSMSYMSVPIPNGDAPPKPIKRFPMGGYEAWADE
jgi:energy-coupling factor transporter transmembrane protein EcfT